MTKQEFIDSLSIDELKAVVSEFYYWYDENGCPKEQHSEYPCEGETEFYKKKAAGMIEADAQFDCGFDCGDSFGCWAEYYVWKLRQSHFTTKGRMEASQKDFKGSWDEAAREFFKGGLTMNWARLGDGVSYTYIGDGLYVVRETDVSAPWRAETFSFYKASSFKQLKKLYYGENDD